MEEQTTDEMNSTCQYFIDSTKYYFSHATKIDSTTSVPYLKRPEVLALKDYTGMISISGNHKGYVYISGNEEMFAELWKFFTGTEASKDDALDMAGEVSNVIAGNVREQLGKDFMISIPIVFQGKPDKMKMHGDNMPVYVIPLEWNGHEAFVVVGVGEN
ncbi:MAG: chemotaxis protein CheX [Cytophagales bacterium]|nr:chemotaxis protein CheX [Cytophagales bacterium]